MRHSEVAARRVRCVELLAEGFGVKAIASQFGITVQTAFRDIAIVRSRPIEIEAVKCECSSLLRQGLSPSKISDKLGIGHKTVLVALEANGHAVRKPKRMTREERSRKTALGLYERGSSVKAIASKMGKEPSWVYASLRREGYTPRSPRLKRAAYRRAIVELYKSGMSTRQVGVQFGISTRRVSAILELEGCPRRRRKVALEPAPS